VFNRQTKIATTIMINMILVLATGCVIAMPRNSYQGSYPDLYTVAINSLLGQTGHLGGRSPHVDVVAVDSFGRKLFFYFESSMVSTYNLLISQKTDGDYVYFYPHNNFISFERAILPWINFEDGYLIFDDLEISYRTSTSNTDGVIAENVVSGYRFEESPFSYNEINDFKIRNSWNQPLKIDNAISTRIVHSKERGPIDNRTLSEAYRTALGEDALGRPSNRTIFFKSDIYGRSIYTGWGRWDGESRRHVVLLFQVDGSFDPIIGIMELYDAQRYQDELKEFKILNNWNQP